MSRPRSSNPKNKHIGIATTEEKFRRFKKLGLKNDEVIDILLDYLEKDDKKNLLIDKSLTVARIKEIDKQIRDLEFERLKLETILEELNEKIGGTGESNMVDKAVGTILQRFNNQNVYNILEFLDFNTDLLKTQAYLCGMSADKLGDLVFEKYEG